MILSTRKGSFLNKVYFLGLCCGTILPYHSELFCLFGAHSHSKKNDKKVADLPTERHYEGVFQKYFNSSGSQLVFGFRKRKDQFLLKRSGNFELSHIFKLKKELQNVKMIHCGTTHN